MGAWVLGKGLVAQMVFALSKERAAALQVSMLTCRRRLLGRLSAALAELCLHR